MKNKLLLNDIEKPSIIPWTGILFVFINILIFFIFNYYRVSLGWFITFIIPSLFINICFFKIEKDIYIREKRKYLALKNEMDILSGHGSYSYLKEHESKNKWQKNMQMFSNKHHKLNHKNTTMEEYSTYHNPLSIYTTANSSI